MDSIRPISWLGPRLARGRIYACAIALLAACSAPSAYERAANERLRRGMSAELSARGDGAPGSPGAEVHLDGTLESYVAYAMAHHPGLEAAFHDWRAAVYQIAEARRLPEPNFSYGVFLRRVETRVGPQRQRFGLSQMIPWPGETSARGDAAAAMAEAAERRFQAQALRIQRQVADAYWNLWQVERTREIEVAQRDLLAALSEATRTRIEIGGASIADLGQIDLAVSRAEDMLATVEERAARARAHLRQTIGAPAELALPMRTAARELALPAESEDALRASARRHPDLEAIDAMARASDEQARVADARGLPDFMVGLDYIETGPASHNPADPESGKDPIVLMVSVSLPIWRGTYDSARDQARAQAAGYRARRANAENLSDADIETALSRVRQSVRRAQLIAHTLAPQAESTYAAVVGRYHTGASALANVFMAQQSVLELARQLIEERAEHGRAWAHLEDVVGRHVDARPLEEAP